MSIELYIVRHGESVENRKRIIQQLHCPLTWRGKRQAKTAGRKLKHLKFNKDYASDQKRVVQTNVIILNQLAEVPTVVEYTINLRERNFGHLRGLTYEKAGIADIPTEELYAMDQGALNILQDVESLQSIRERTSNVKKRILEARHPKNLIVAHEWLNSYLMNELLGEEITVETFHGQKNCSVSYFRLDEQGKVLECRIAQDEI